MILKILIYFLCKNCTPPLWNKSLPLFPINPPPAPSKRWGPVKSSLFENLVRLCRKRGLHTMHLKKNFRWDGNLSKKRTPCFDPVNYYFLDLAFWKIKGFTKLLFKRPENVLLFSDFLQGYSECKLLAFWKTKLCENFHKLFNVYCNHVFTSVRIA